MAAMLLLYLSCTCMYMAWVKLKKYFFYWEFDFTRSTMFIIESVCNIIDWLKLFGGKNMIVSILIYTCNCICLCSSSIGSCRPHIVDVDWRLDYYIKVSTSTRYLSYWVRFIRVWERENCVFCKGILWYSQIVNYDTYDIKTTRRFSVFFWVCLVFVGGGGLVRKAPSISWMNEWIKYSSIASNMCMSRKTWSWYMPSKLSPNYLKSMTTDAPQRGQSIQSLYYY